MNRSRKTPKILASFIGTYKHAGDSAIKLSGNIVFSYNEYKETVSVTDYKIN